MTNRDLAFLTELGEVTVLSVDVIHRRYFAADRTGKSCRRRLHYLTAAKFVTPVAITAHIGPRTDHHTVYRLTSTGADWLTQRTGQIVRVLKTDPKADTLLHRVLVARTVLALADGALTAGRSKPSWLLESDRWPHAPRDVPEPRQYRLTFDFLGIPINPGRPIEQYGPPVYDDPTVTLVKARPDAACVLTVSDVSAPLVLLFEVDAGTETVSQLTRKLPGYHAILTRRTFCHPWQDLIDQLPVGARVLFVFTSEERMHNFLDYLTADSARLWARTGVYCSSAADKERAAAFLESCFRFTTLDELEKADCLRRQIWYTLFLHQTSGKLAMSTGGM
ncbi:MAG TPA: replication-relaxation family protein [Gemmataceae bacterium]|nr:replication-relaxation family protein [Gemmataceae bacterium]